jgi:hypothetical protein
LDARNLKTVARLKHLLQNDTCQQGTQKLVARYGERLNCRGGTLWNYVELSGTMWNCVELRGTMWN